MGHSPTMYKCFSIFVFAHFPKAKGRKERKGLPADSAEKGERGKEKAVLFATRGEATGSTSAAETAAQTR